MSQIEIDLTISIVSFLLGVLLGWRINHWYSVNLKEPQLSQNGSGGGSSIFGTAFHYSHITVRNELRTLTIKLPETMFLGKRIKTHFGNQIVERSPAKECAAQLLDESRKYICHLYWLDNNKILDFVDIESGKSASLLLFVRKEEDSKNFYVYQPISQSDLTPKVAKVPSFSKSTNFLVRISYSYNKSFSFPVGVEIDYNENFYATTKNGSRLF